MERGQRKLILRMADTMGLLVSEQPLYGWISFIAEFGGALGLFLGFAFTDTTFLLIDLINAMIFKIYAMVFDEKLGKAMYSAFQTSTLR